MKLPFRGRAPGGHSKSCYDAGLLLSPAVEPVAPIENLSPRGTARSDQVWPANDVDVLAFLERWLEGLEPPSAPVPSGDLAARALELANADWPHHDAAVELARLADHDCQLLKTAGKSLVTWTPASPVSDAQAARVGKVLRLALQRSAVHVTGKSRRREDHDGRH